jgi:hypothetical protein
MKISNSIPKVLLLFLIFNFTEAQSLHHQMISSQGGSSLSPNENLVFFTVGQQSVIGNTSNSFSVQQGFQQSNWSKIIQQNTISISTIVYPNPFKDFLKFSFSKSPGNDISLVVFDLVGRLVYSEIVNNEANLISVNLSNLPNAEYLIKLTANKYIFSTKVIKQ